jgi:hypothetical protein
VVRQRFRSGAFLWECEPIPNNRGGGGSRALCLRTILKRRGEFTWAYVVYGEEDGGKSWSRGYVWRGERFTNQYYVQNGNIRDDGGRVGASVPTAAAPWDDIDVCDVDNALCWGVVLDGCTVGGMVIALTCGPSVGVTCATGGALVTECGLQGGDAMAGCRKWASDGTCP